MNLNGRKPMCTQPYRALQKRLRKEKYMLGRVMQMASFVKNGLLAAEMSNPQERYQRHDQRSPIVFLSFETTVK
jgi:hypothetical protein